MKINNFFIILIASLFLSTSHILSQEKYYYAFDEKIFLYEVENKVVLSFNREYLSEINEYLQDDTNILHMELQIFNNVFILTTENPYIETLKKNVSQRYGIKSINPLFITYEGLEMALTDEIIMQFKENVSQQEIDEMHAQYNVSVKETTPLYQLISISNLNDPLEIANLYQRSGLVNFSHPNFIAKIDFFQYTPIDPYFINQFYLHNTGQIVNGRYCTEGADIRAVNAWEITKGNNNITVAILDQGVTSNHPDLPNTRQIRLNGSNFADGNPNDPSPTGNGNHGNSCAGIIAASHNNEGIAGIAPNCKILPIRIFNSTGGGISSDLIAQSITFAKNNDADIISNSWGYAYNTNPNSIPVIVNAISDATINGRNGKGCVVLFSTGNTANHVSNQSGSINFPSNVEISGVLTVGASDRNDTQANYSPTSNLNSQNNQIIDIMAPSHKAYSSQISTESFDIWSIDIPGSDGYNPVKNTDGGTLPTIGTYLPIFGVNYLSYTGHFGGTSASCPQVAGVAALVLSVNPNLTQTQVADIIRSTARKAGNYNYQTTSGLPHGTWNSKMGYGVVDSHKAVVAAWFYGKTIAGPSAVPVCETAVFSFTAPLPPGGYTFRWRVSNDMIILSGQNTNSIVVQRVPVSSTGQGWICVDIMKSGTVVHTVCKSINGTISGIASIGGANLSTEDFTITSNTTWSGMKTLGVKATVATGVTLTITGTVYCTDNALIIVQPGGKLVIDGGTLAAACDGKMWKGIVVLGNKNLSQTVQNQGYVELKNNAKIEHALCAISAAPASYGNNATGGIIKATDATFSNNFVAIEYRPFENYSSGRISDNVGRFTRCSFIKDNNNRFAANKLNFQNHITMNEVRGVTFEGCDFQNTAATGYRGAGIRTLDAGVKVKNYCPNVAFPGVDCSCPSSLAFTTPSIFYNHAIGIYSNNAGTPRSIYVDQSDFNLINQGVRISTQNNYRLTRCTFTDIQQRGLYSNSSSGYRIEENNFSTSNKNASGIEMDNSGYAENRIYKNTFTNLNRGIDVQRKNGTVFNPEVDEDHSGLQLICNEFNGNILDIYIWSTATVHPYQGHPFGVDNQFNTNSSTISSLYSNSPHKIFYYHSPGNNHAPKNPASNVTVYATAAQNLCKSTFCTPIIIIQEEDGTKSGADSIELYKAMQQQYDKLLAQLKDNPELLQEILTLSNAMRELSDHAISRILGDSILYLDALKQWYEVVRTPIAKYNLAEVYAYESKYDQAEAVLREIPDLFAFNETEMIEHNNYMQFYHFKKQLKLSERTWEELDETEIAQLQTIAETTKGRSASMAKGVLCFFFNICYEDEIENFQPLEGSGEASYHSEVIPPVGELMGVKTQTYNLILYPNPTESEMTVTTNNPAIKIVEMEIFDLFGKKIHQQTVSQSYGILQLNDLDKGVYILKVYLNQGDLIIRKIVKK